MIRKESVLFCGPPCKDIEDWLRSKGAEVTRINDKYIDQRVKFLGGFDWIISYNYNHKISKAVLDGFKDKAINLHISYLPWNRGNDPNFWSFVEDTPKGVTIHYMDEGIDTGDIIAQKQVEFDSSQDTLATSYNKLHTELQVLFKEEWSGIKTGACPRRKQIGKGSVHKTKDKERLAHLLRKGWNTPIEVLDGYAAETQMTQQFWDKYDDEIEEIRNESRVPVIPKPSNKSICPTD